MTLSFSVKIDLRSRSDVDLKTRRTKTEYYKVLGFRLFLLLLSQCACMLCKLTDGNLCFIEYIRYIGRFWNQSTQDIPSTAEHEPVSAWAKTPFFSSKWKNPHVGTTPLGEADGCAELLRPKNHLCVCRLPFRGTGYFQLYGRSKTPCPPPSTSSMFQSSTLGRPSI